MSSQQTVYRVTGHNSLDDIKTFTEDIPTPTRHEVLIEIKAVSLNFRDLAISNKTYPFPIAPNVVPVSDCAAVVSVVGEGVEGYSKGDKVVVSFDGTNTSGQMKDWFHGHGGPVDGFLRQWAVVPSTALVKVPAESKLSFAELSTLVCTGVTSWNAMFAIDSIKPGDTILVQGTGGVSMTVLVLAKAFGATVIVTSSDDKKLETAKTQYGADFGINYKTNPNWGAEAVKLNGGQGVDLVIENGGAGTIAESMEAIRMGGKIAVIGFLARPEGDMPDVTSMILGKAASVRGITVGSRVLLEEVVKFVCARGLHLPVAKVFKFEEALEAYKFMKKSSHIGKVCIEM